jgi:tetratricopeptide (TPR) repeat protein
MREAEKKQTNLDAKWKQPIKSDWKKFLTKKFWILFSNKVRNLTSSFEKSFRDQFYSKPLRASIFIVLMFCGLLPQIFIITVKFFQAKSTNQNILSESLLAEGLELYEEGKDKQAINKFGQALKKNPQSSHAISEFAALYILQNDSKKAAVYLKKLVKIDSQSPYLPALNGLSQLQRGNFAQAEKLLKKAYIAKLKDAWILDAYGESLIAQGKNVQAFKVAGWPTECKINSVAQASCMRKLADWHRKVSEIILARSLKVCDLKQKNLNEKISFHRQRQVVYLDESLKSLLRGIEEVDGKYRLELIKQYEQEKINLIKSHAKFLLGLHLSQENVLETELTKLEKRVKPYSN